VGRIFSLLAVTAVLMILTAGGGMYWMLNTAMTASRQDAAVAVAKGVGLNIAAQIAVLNRILDKMAQDIEVMDAIASADPDVLNEVTSKFEKYVPDILKIRLLLPGVSELDETSVPRMGFADLDMVRETFINNPLPSIQGNNGPDRHLAITRRIIHNGEVTGVILASLKYDFIGKSLQAAAINGQYLELKQAALVLGSAGAKTGVEQSETSQIKIPNTDWDIHYRYAGGASPVDFSVLAGIISIPALLTLLAFFVGYNNLSALLTQDLGSLMKAFKDIMGHSFQGNYPVQLNELKSVISTLMQFKRVLDNKEEIGREDDFDLNITVSDDEDFELNGFFEDTGHFKKPKGG
jgi:phosphomannomutase/phosphoglucomutase